MRSFEWAFWAFTLFFASDTLLADTFVPQTPLFAPLLLMRSYLT
jgi:hypothetical protein